MAIARRGVRLSATAMSHLPACMPAMMLSQVVSSTCSLTSSVSAILRSTSIATPLHSPVLGSRMACGAATAAPTLSTPSLCTFSQSFSWALAGLPANSPTRASAVTEASAVLTMLRIFGPPRAWAGAGLPARCRSVLVPKNCTQIVDKGQHVAMRDRSGRGRRPGRSRSGGWISEVPGEAAVDPDVLAGDVARAIRQQERDRLRHLADRADPLRGHARRLSSLCGRLSMKPGRTLFMRMPALAYWSA